MVVHECYFLGFVPLAQMGVDGMDGDHGGHTEDVRNSPCRYVNKPQCNVFTGML